jgi:hypothetical protein
MKRTLVLALLTVATQAAADDRSTAASFMECARIADDARRLACYDRLATDLIELGLSRQTPAAPPPQPGAPTIVAPPAPTAPAVAAAAPAPPPPPAASPAPAAAPTGRAEASFGSERLEGGAKSELDEIRSRHVGEFNGWDGKTIFQLENGQVWQQTRSGRLVWKADSPMITIKRGFMGGYRLSVEGVNKDVYVKRIK